MRPVFVVLLSFFVLSFHPSAFAVKKAKKSKKSNCGKVVFNCDTHRMTLNGRSTPINCGRATPTLWSGKIGYRGKAAGSVFPSMRGAPMVTLIPPPANRNIVVHLMPPKSGRTPAGHNRGAGCIHVAPKELERLSQCSGSPYQVIFNDKGKYKYAAKDRKKVSSKKDKKKKRNPVWRGKKNEPGVQ